MGFMTILNAKQERFCTRAGKLDQMKLIDDYMGMSIMLAEDGLTDLDISALKKIEGGVCVFLCMAWIKGQLSPTEAHAAFSMNPKKRDPGYENWHQSQMMLISQGAQWYMENGVKSFVRDFYKKAADDAGLQIDGDDREYANVADCLYKESYQKLNGWDVRTRAVVGGMPCIASGKEGGHAVALCLDEQERTHFFDPNFGEFIVELGQEDQFFKNYVSNVLEGHLKWILKGAFGYYVKKR